MIRSIVVAASRNDVIGYRGALPWHIPEDLRRFRQLTMGHPVIVGRLTYDSIVNQLGRPLPGRTSIVISSQAQVGSSGQQIWVPSVASAISKAQELEARGLGSEVFIIGGASVYQQTLSIVDKVYLTRVHEDVSGDSVMPTGWLTGFRLVDREDSAEESAQEYSFLEYNRELLSWVFIAWKITEPQSS
jgi:dihydrofolate reductase